MFGFINTVDKVFWPQHWDSIADVSDVIPSSERINANFNFFYYSYIFYFLSQSQHYVWWDCKMYDLNGLRQNLIS